MDQLAIAAIQEARANIQQAQVNHAKLRETLVDLLEPLGLEINTFLTQSEEDQEFDTGEAIDIMTRCRDRLLQVALALKA